MFACRIVNKSSTRLSAVPSSEKGKNIIGIQEKNQGLTCIDAGTVTKVRTR